jgi:hypothetical protein
MIHLTKLVTKNMVTYQVPSCGAQMGRHTRLTADGFRKDEIDCPDCQKLLNKISR